jgi:hypothetical protein
MALGLDAEFIDRLVGDGGGDNLALADIDANMRGGRALLHFDDGAFDLVACTDAHDGSLEPRAVKPRTRGLSNRMKGWDRRPRGAARLRRNGTEP